MIGWPTETGGMRLAVLVPDGYQRASTDAGDKTTVAQNVAVLTVGAGASRLSLEGQAPTLEFSIEGLRPGR